MSNLKRKLSTELQDEERSPTPDLIMSNEEYDTGYFPLGLTRFPLGTPSQSKRSRQVYSDLADNQAFLQHLRGQWVNKLESLKTDRLLLEKMKAIKKEQLTGVEPLFCRDVSNENSELEKESASQEMGESSTSISNTPVVEDIDPQPLIDLELPLFEQGQFHTQAVAEGDNEVQSQIEQEPQQELQPSTSSALRYPTGQSSVTQPCPVSLHEKEDTPDDSFSETPLPPALANNLKWLEAIRTLQQLDKKEEAEKARMRQQQQHLQQQQLQQQIQEQQIQEQQMQEQQMQEQQIQEQEQQQQDHEMSHETEEDKQAREALNKLLQEFGDIF